MTNTAPEIDKYGYHKKMAPPKMIFHKNNIYTLQKDALIFKREFLNLLHDSVIKIEFFLLQNDITITLLNLIVGGRFY